MSKEKSIYPEPVTGGVIYNDKNEVLFIKNKKWGDTWNIPGGHIEIGETGEETLKREIKEETNLDIDNVEFFMYSDGINPEGFFEPRHFIFLDFCAKKVGGKETKTNEMSEYVWMDPKKAIKELKMTSIMADLIKNYMKFRGKDKDTELFEEKYQKSLANYQNLIKQTENDKKDFVKYASESLIQEIIPVYNNLKVSIKNLTPEQSENAWVEGVKYVIKQFKDILKNNGVEEIKTAGKKFDHHTMEAIKGKGDKVKEEVQPGYTLKGKVIIHAKVVLE